jgi:hypothetical protein
MTKLLSALVAVILIPTFASGQDRPVPRITRMSLSTAAVDTAVKATLRQTESSAGPSVTSDPVVSNDFHQLKANLAVGQKITLIDQTRRTFKGKVAALTSSSIRVVAKDGSEREFGVGEVRKVTKSDSLLNGALMGWLIPAAVASVVTAGICGDASCLPETILGAALYGAPIGIGIDALKRKVVYKRD